MGFFIRLIISLVFLITAIDKAEGIPVISFPISAQVPPVAHGGIFFDFTFSGITFSNASSNLSYSMNGAASWLNLNSAIRRFSGTPREGDEEVMAFDLVATDSTGSTTMPVNFVITDVLGPQLADSANTSVILTGPFGGPRSIVLSPGATVNFALNSSIFVDTNITTQYYAVCSDNSPLPSWLIFNPSDLSFSGTTPGASSPSELPQVYDLRVIATDTPGFSSAAYPIRLTVDLHLLTFATERTDINVTVGQAFNYTYLKNNLTLDGKVIDSSLISSVLAQAPSWLSVDPNNLAISGTPPQDFASQSFWISVNDTYGDEANTTVWLFTGLSESNNTQILGPTIPSIIAFPGQNVSYTIPASAFLSSNISTSVDPKNCSSWLHYSPSSLTFYGIVPANMFAQTCAANLTVSEGSLSVWELVPVSIINSSNASSTTLLLPSSSATATSSAPSSTASSWPQPDPEFNHVALITGVIICGIILLPYTIWQFCRCVSLRKIRKEEERKEAERREAESRAAELSEFESISELELDLIAPFRLQEPSDSPFASHPNWYGSPRSASAGSETSSAVMNDHSVTQNRDSPFPLSTEARGGPERRRGMPLPSARNTGFGHGGTAPPVRVAPVILGSATVRAPGQAPRHRPLPVNYGSASSNFNVPAVSAPTDDSFETIEEEPVQEPARSQAAVRPGLARRVLQNFGRAQRRPFVSSHFSIRPVAKSPTPSEMASPELTSSPRAKLQSYVHDRATERQVSGFFSASSTRRDTERGLIVPPPGPSVQNQANVTRFSRIRSPPLRAPIFNSEIFEAHSPSPNAAESVQSRSPVPSASTQALPSTMGDDPFYNSSTANKRDKGKGKAVKHSHNESIVTNSDAWVDDAPESSAQGAMKSDTSSSIATSYVASSDGLGSSLRRTRAMFNISRAADQQRENGHSDRASRRQSSVFNFL